MANKLQVAIVLAACAMGYYAIVTNPLVRAAWDYFMVQP